VDFFGTQCRYSSAADSFTLTVSSTVPGGMLHSSLQHFLSAVSVVCQLPPAVRTSPLAFNIPSLGLLCGLSEGLDTAHDLTHLFDSFWRDLKTFLFAIYNLLQRIRGFVTMCRINSRLTLTLQHL